MVFKKFYIQVVLRTIFMSLSIFLSILAFQQDDMIFAGLLLLFFIVFQVLGLIHYVNQTNTKLKTFLESIRYADFSTTFSTDDSLGKSFKELNIAFNDVMESFRKTRAEKEENLLFLYVVLQHIQTGILSFNQKGEIGMINNAAKKTLQIPQLRHIDDIKSRFPALHDKIKNLKPGQNEIIKLDSMVQLSLRYTEVKMGGNNWSVLALQNIHDELQKNELQAWQNLTKVLRHEIMNSITPIATLVGSMNDILKYDMKEEEEQRKSMNEETYDDLLEGLKTIENRSKGLIRFVDAYRDYTSIPTPQPHKVVVTDLIENVCSLMRSEFGREQIQVEKQILPENLELYADEELIQMVLINLLKNAKEALHDTESKKISIYAAVLENKEIVIQVIDNGPGIVPEAIERIFVPFFTTKKTGSGIGLALSRQIMHLHKGSLTVQSQLGERTIFSLRFAG